MYGTTTVLRLCLLQLSRNERRTYSKIGSGEMNMERNSNSKDLCGKHKVQGEAVMTPAKASSSSCSISKREKEKNQRSDNDPSSNCAFVVDI